MAKLVEHLRAATEDDVDAALRDANIALPLTDTAQLLEFYNRVLDVKLGIQPDATGIALIAPKGSETKH